MSFLVISSYKDTNPIGSVLHLLTLSDPNSLPKAPSPNTITLEARDSTYEFVGSGWGRDSIQSIATVSDLLERVPL